MDTTVVKAKKNLFNRGKCFTKGHIYVIDRTVKSQAGLMEARTYNDNNEPHIIGSWWRNFELI